jgi:7-carboxy-7-deazaguanine synthase
MLALPIMEHFATIQGEGRFSGTAAYFIRTGGCDVGCHWCDVKESWPMYTHPTMTIAELIRLLNDSGLKVAVITGGEPAMHDLDELTSQLRHAGIRTHIETSGTHPLTGTWDWITFSPKKFKKPLTEVASLASELKVIVSHKSDFDFAQQHAATVSKDCLLYLQPEWDKREVMTPIIIDFIKQNPKWRISLQTHKYMNIP